MTNELPKNTKSPGFTLIEILVVLTITSIIFGLGYANFRDYSRRQALDSVAGQIEVDLRLTQELALSAQKPASALCEVLDGYVFRNGTLVNTYTISAFCSGALGAGFYESIGKENIPIPSGYGLSLSPARILFKALGHGTDLDPTEIFTVTITQTATGNSKIVTVTAGGEIK